MASEVLQRRDRISDAQNSRATSVTFNEPALELIQKTVFDERVTS